MNNNKRQKESNNQSNNDMPKGQRETSCNGWTKEELFHTDISKISFRWALLVCQFKLFWRNFRFVSLYDVLMYSNITGMYDTLVTFVMRFRICDCYRNLAWSIFRFQWNASCGFRNKLFHAWDKGCQSCELWRTINI